MFLHIGLPLRRLLLLLNLVVFFLANSLWASETEGIWIFSAGGGQQMQLSTVCRCKVACNLSLFVSFGVDGNNGLLVFDLGILLGIPGS